MGFKIWGFHNIHSERADHLNYLSIKKIRKISTKVGKNTKDIKFETTDVTFVFRKTLKLHFIKICQQVRMYTEHGEIG